MKQFIKNLTRAVVIGVAAMSAFTPSYAHHSFAMYDSAKPESITGVLVHTNPDAFHFQMFIAQLNEDRTKVIRDKDNKPLIWVVEMDGAGAVAAEGVTESNFQPGSIVSIGLFPLRDGHPGGTRNQFGLFRCPDKTPPAAGKMCDSVQGAKPFGAGTLPGTEGRI